MSTKVLPIDAQSMEDGSRKPFSILNALSSFRRLLTVDEVADLLSISSCTLYRMAQRKQIPSLIISGSRRFDPATIAAWLAKKRTATCNGRSAPDGGMS